ncbi:plasmid mobilization protein [Longimicrobium sp.]|uniref:plasmid mobilization protein n=1 Tax=Longimicrobium sp. TaxID=2029185 RepID=UPI002F94D730
MSRRTLRKPTRWTPEEWAQVERAAADRGVPPLRYVREAALGTPPAPQPGRGQPLTPARRARSLWHQLARVGNNLHQLRRVAEIDGDDDGVRVLTAAAGSVEYVISAAPTMLGARGDEVIASVIEAGNALNALAHRANTAEELPPMDALRSVLAQVEKAVREALP